MEESGWPVGSSGCLQLKDREFSWDCCQGHVG